MFNLDPKTKVEKPVFKKLFNLTKSQDAIFKSDVSKITINNIINSRTTTITQLEENHEICIFTLELKQRKITSEVINIINHNIKQLNIFVLVFDDSFCYYIDGFTSNWNEQIEFNFTGINTRVIYENCIRAINKETNNLSLEKIEKKKELEGLIAKLEVKKNREKQMNRKKEIRDKIIKLKIEIKKL